jgi:hypothetical protein
MGIWIGVAVATVGLVWIAHLLRQSWVEDRRDRASRAEQAERTETLVRWRP